MRQRNKPWADDFLTEHQDIVEPNPVQYKNNWSSFFGNSNPLHLEIGTGKGQFIVGMAQQYQQVNFIGIEKEKSIIVSAAQKVMESEQKNILLINENAQDVRELFGSREVDKIYLNFSDPWPKSRHEKRRLTFRTFLEQYSDILKEDGKIELKTDNRGLFEYTLVSFSNYGLILDEVTLDLHKEEDPKNIMTEYEEKFSKKGPIYRCVAQFPPTKEG